MSDLEFSIRKGPSRDRLIDALKYAYDNGVEIPIGLYAVPRVSNRSRRIVEVRDVRIIGLVHADSSGHLFRLQGICRLLLDEVEISNSHDFIATYDTSSQTGVLTFKDFED